MTHQKFIKECLEEASVIAREKFGKVTGTAKQGDNNQVLTAADLVIGELIIGKIKKAFPRHNIIDEEAGVTDNGSEYTWIIDPIDGTSNFAVGVPTYGIMVGLLSNNLPIAGGFILPETKEIGVAEKGKGAFINGQKLKVTNESRLQHCLVAYHIDGHPEDAARAKAETELFGEIIKQVRNMRSTGCEPWDAALVASGKYGAILNQTMKIWDVVVPQLIIEESGGMYTDFFGQPIDYRNPLTKTEQNFTCCAAPSVLHKQLQEIIHRLR